MAKSGVTKFRRLLTQHRHVGIDSMCFIYQFSAHPTYSSLTNCIFEKLEQDTLSATTSTISLIESLVLPERKHQDELIREYQQVFRLIPNLKVISVDFHLSLLTAKLRGMYPQLRIPDAIQISAAILDNASIFITNDKHFTKVRQIKVKLLDEYV